MQTAECGSQREHNNKQSIFPPTKAELKPSASIRQREQESRGFATLIQEQRPGPRRQALPVDVLLWAEGARAAPLQPPPAPLFAAWLPSKYILTSVGSALRSAPISTAEMAAGSDRAPLQPLAARGRPPARRLPSAMTCTRTRKLTQM